MLNLANNERQADRLREMRSLMKQDLEAIGRPLESSSQASTPRPLSDQRTACIGETIEIQGKKNHSARGVESKAGETDQIKMDNKIIKKAKREERKKSRQAGMKKTQLCLCVPTSMVSIQCQCQVKIVTYTGTNWAVKSSGHRCDSD